MNRHLGTKFVNRGGTLSNLISISLWQVLVPNYVYIYIKRWGEIIVGTHSYIGKYKYLRFIENQGTNGTWALSQNIWAATN